MKMGGLMNRVAWFSLLCVLCIGCSSRTPVLQGIEPHPLQGTPEAPARSAAEQKISALQEEREQLLVTLGEFHDRIRELESMLADRDGRPVAKSYDELLASKEEELAELRKLLPEREKQAARITAVTATLENVRQRMSNLEQQLGLRDQELAALRPQANAVADLEAARRHIWELEQQASRQEMELRALKSGSAERESLVAQLQTATGMLDRLKERVAALEHHVADRDQEIGLLRAGLTEREKLLNQAKALASEVQQARARTAAMETQLSNKSREVESLRGMTAERDTLLAQLTARNAELGQAKQLMNEMANQGSPKPVPSKSAAVRHPQTNPPVAATPLPSQLPQPSFSQAREELVKLLHTEAGIDTIAVKERGARLTVALPSHMLFSAGDATLKPEGISMLKRIGNILGQLPDTSVQVAGHTDNQQLSKSLRKTFPNNKALSWARAENARRALINGGLPADLSKAVGFADSKPIASNNSEEGRQKNRRVELVISQAGRHNTATLDRAMNDSRRVASLSSNDKSGSR
jgi:chemotaxis protein MotB